MIEPWQIALLMDCMAIIILNVAVRFDWIAIKNKRGAVALILIFLILLLLIFPISEYKCFSV